MSTTIALPRDASQWPPIVRMALTWISHHDAGIGDISLPLEGPRWIPSGVLSPMATSTVGLQYSVGLWNTTTALAVVNSPSFNHDTTASAAIARWTIGAGGSAQSHPLTSLEGVNGFWFAPHGSETAVNLGHGIIGNYYAYGEFHSGVINGESSTVRHLIVWHEGQWIWEVGQGSESADQMIAERLVSYFHQALLPPSPGVGVVINLHQKPLTRMDWSPKGAAITVHLSDSIPSLANPIDTAHMAVSWQG